MVRLSLPIFAFNILVVMVGAQGYAASIIAGQDKLPHRASKRKKLATYQSATAVIGSLHDFSHRVIIQQGNHFLPLPITPWSTFAFDEDILWLIVVNHRRHLIYCVVVENFFAPSTSFQTIAKPYQGSTVLLVWSVITQAEVLKIFEIVNFVFRDIGMIIDIDISWRR